LKRICFIILLLLGFFKAQADCTTQSVDAPVIDSVSVLPNGDVEICWKPGSVDPSVVQYNIWTVDGTGANLQIGSVGSGTLCFTYLAADNNSGSESIQILIEAVDNCPAPGPFSSGIFPGGFVNTIYLQENFNKCTSSISLNWNAYDDFPNPLVRYEVYAIVDGGQSVLVATTFSTSYEYLGVTLGSTYDFYVTAVENGGVGPFKSTSNVVNSDVSTALISPTFNYLYNATVVGSEQIDLQFLIDTIADVTGYNVMRSTNENGPFEIIGSVDKVLGMDTIIDYSDSTVNTDTSSYFYQIEIVNETCDFDGNFSNLASTILIDVTSSPVDAKNTITITEYKDWELGVLRYDVYRALGGVWEANPIRTLLAFSDTTIIIDDVSEVFDGNGEFCYRVEAISKGSLPAISSSNESCALHDPLLYVPNAFSPGSPYNPEFKPVLTFAEPLSYTFRVYDRWGQVAFETGDIARGWNGSYGNKGKLAETGVYFYVIEFKSASGDDFVKRGTVTVVY